MAMMMTATRPEDKGGGNGKATEVVTRAIAARPTATARVRSDTASFVANPRAFINVIRVSDELLSVRPMDDSPSGRGFYSNCSNTMGLFESKK
jgi:hypothetical protein